tara:strand:+ start:326 stop:613 length:288 start_codon:yes stop_codon:yes gene_type:complete
MGKLWLINCYTFDKCDGEIACVNAMSSEWGAYFDDFVNWLVDSAFFTALGSGFGKSMVKFCGSGLALPQPSAPRSMKSSILSSTGAPKTNPGRSR